jgi:tRNA-dihydrouridine synthase A
VSPLLPGAAPSRRASADERTPPNHRLVVAPMMKRTFPAFRHLLRRITRHTLLVTEMISVRSLVHGDRESLLPVAADGPVSVQLGGSDPTTLAAAARWAVLERGYDEVDLNCGCPSDRATDADVGACLMRTPDTVARAVEAMAAAVDVPVTVKCRIGTVDEPLDDWDDHEVRVRDVEGLDSFARLVTDAGAARVAVHARVAVLEGLDTRQNRSVPPLRHAEVHDLAGRRPGTTWQCNGGVRDLDDALAHLEHVDGVMVGRAAWDDPMLFAAADRRVFGDDSRPDPEARDVLDDVLPGWEATGDLPGVIDLRSVESLAGMRHGRPGAKRWRHGLAQLRQRGDVTATDVLRLWDELPD